MFETNKDVLHFLSKFAFVGWFSWVSTNKFVNEHVPVCPVMIIKTRVQTQTKFLSLLEISCFASRSSRVNSSVYIVDLSSCE